MKNISIICILFSLVALTSCYDEDQYWLDDNIIEGGTYYPVIQKLTVDPAVDTIDAGTTITLDLYYWSRDDVRDLRYDLVDVDAGTTETLETVAYTESWDAETEAEKFSKSYQIPTDASGKSLKYEVTVTTVNDLTRTASISYVVR